MHKRRARTCEICEQTYIPNDYRQRACGRACGQWVRCKVFSSVVEWVYCDTCSGWFTRRAKHRHPAPVRDTSWMTKVIECPVCGEGFTNPFTTIAVHCSKRCSKKASKLRRRVREAGTYGHWRWSDFMRMAQRFGYCCAYCGEKPDRLDPDHVLPLSRGGPNVLANLLPACPSCNSDKGSSTLAEWSLRREAKGKPPRLTEWDDRDPRFAHLTYGTKSVAA